MLFWKNCRDFPQNVPNIIYQARNQAFAKFISAKSYKIQRLCETKLDKNFSSGQLFLPPQKLMEAEKEKLANKIE